MFLFDHETSSIRNSGEVTAELRNLKIKAVVYNEEGTMLSLKSFTTEQIENNGDVTTEYKLEYGDETGSIRTELLLSAFGSFMAVRVNAEIFNQTAYHRQRFFDAHGGIRLGVGQITGLLGLLANSRHKDWWTRPHFDMDLRRLPPQTQSLLWRTGDGYGYLLPVCDPLCRTDLAGSKEGLEIQISTLESGHQQFQTLAFIVGAGRNPYSLVSDTVRQGFISRNTGGMPRSGKKYPEILEYLGWCSWDAFYSDVSEEGLADKAAELKAKGLPVRWFMIDDGWSDAKEMKLNSFNANSEKFPYGLGHAIRRLKDEYGISWVGVWHNIAGYWNGIDPEGEVFKEFKEYLHETRKGKWIPSAEAGKGFAFWNEWHSRLQRQGADFVKVDNQSSLYSYYGEEQSIAKIAHSVHIGLEASVALHFNGCMINCMGMASENVWHRPMTSVSRSSNDFLPKIYNGFGEHALQNAYNSVYHGPFYWGDWDMFWTDHHDAVPHMVLRAVCGGPVYFSDRPDKTRPEIIWPLVYSDGRIIRCDGIGQPTEDCLTIDPMQTSTPLKLWNTAGGAGIAAAFHVFNGDETVAGEIGPKDIPGLEGESFIVFDALRKTAHRLKADEVIPVRLAPLEAELYLIIPADGPFTAIGLADKLAATDAILGVESIAGAIEVRIKDRGDFMFVSKRKPVQAFVDRKPASVQETDGGIGLYRIVCPMDSCETPNETMIRIEFEIPS